MKTLVLASAAALALGLGIARAADGNGCPKQLAGSGAQSEQAGGAEAPSPQAAPDGPQGRQQFAAAPERMPNTASGSQLAVIDPNCRTSQNK